MMSREEALAKALAPVVKGFVNDMLTALPKPEKGESIVGPPGPAGRDADPVDINSIIESVLVQIPKPKDGRDGKDGNPGLDGRDGKDGTPGPKGDPGQRGERGEKGDPGESIFGPIGPKGDKGDPGDRGPEGAPGALGVPGINGKDGADGRDALEIDILPQIDPEKEYPRGTFAVWDGGLVRSYRNTIPQTREPNLMKAGWFIVVPGLAEISFSLANEGRKLLVNCRKTGHGTEIAEFDIPSMIYRGVYKSETEYAPGDVVTWGGSAWHCQKQTTGAPKENAGEWRLMVKEGRSGKDGKDGDRGPQGPPGKDRDLTQLSYDGKKY